MVRSALADETLLPYIQNLAKPDTCTVGLILGQTSASKDFVIHFAKTPPSQTVDKIKKPNESINTITKIEDVSDYSVADHAKHATRMLPGGMYVLGIFVVSTEDLLTPFHAKIRTILCQIHKQLSASPYLFGNQESPEKLILNYCVPTKLFTCKSYNVITSSVKPAEFKFQPKAMKWNQLECKYDVDQTFPIFQGRYDWTLKKHLQAVLETINNQFTPAVFVYDNEIRNSDETLESLGKKKKSKNLNKDKNDSKAIQVSIFLPCDNKELKEDLEITGCGGFIRIMGQVSSKLWLYPRMTVQEASQAVVEDIVRSLTSRLEMHWDSLVDEESGSSDDTNSLHEPPRRVLITLPANKVMLSDYLFPGEGPHEALTSLQELLDINIKDKKSILDVEGQADLAEIYPPQEIVSVDSEENLPIKLNVDSNRQVYILGFGVALLVLIMSLLVHVLKG